MISAEAWAAFHEILKDRRLDLIEILVHATDTGHSDRTKGRILEIDNLLEYRANEETGKRTLESE